MFSGCSYLLLQPNYDVFGKPGYAPTLDSIHPHSQCAFLFVRQGQTQRPTMLMRTGQFRSVIVVRSKCQANALDGFEPSENIYEPVEGVPPLFRGLRTRVSQKPSQVWLVGRNSQKKWAEKASPSQSCTGIGILGTTWLCSSSGLKMGDGPPVMAKFMGGIIP